MIRAPGKKWDELLIDEESDYDSYRIVQDIIGFTYSSLHDVLGDFDGQGTEKTYSDCR